MPFIIGGGGEVGAWDKAACVEEEEEEEEVHGGWGPPRPPRLIVFPLIEGQPSLSRETEIVRAKGKRREGGSGDRCQPASLHGLIQEG